MKITKRVLAAIDRILLDSRSIDPKIDGQIQTDEGVAVTNGFVLVHSPVDFGRKFAKNANAELGGYCSVGSWLRTILQEMGFMK